MRDPLDSANDDWTGNPEIDRMRLVQRALESQRLHMSSPKRLSEEERVRIEQGDPDDSSIALAFFAAALLVGILIFVVLAL